MTLTMVLTAALFVLSDDPETRGEKPSRQDLAGLWRSCPDAGLDDDPHYFVLLADGSFSEMTRASIGRGQWTFEGGRVRMAVGGYDLPAGPFLAIKDPIRKTFSVPEVPADTCPGQPGPSLALVKEGFPPAPISVKILPLARAGKPAETSPHMDVPTIPARPEDVSSLDGIMKAFYETISGPAGQPRQWARDRTLYVPGVRFVSSGRKDGKVFARVEGHQEYVDRTNDGLVREGFFEGEVHRVTKSFGNVTHVFSTYESRTTPDGPVTARGVNSVQLFHDGQRWWIASAVWDVERPDNPIPKELLP